MQSSRIRCKRFNFFGYEIHTLLAFGAHLRNNTLNLLTGKDEQPLATSFTVNTSKAKLQLARMQDCMIRNSDRHRLESPNPKIGELVLLDSDGITIEVEEKIKRKFLGPYRIVQVDYDLQNYTLALPKNMQRLHPIFHISKLIFREKEIVPMK